MFAAFPIRYTIAGVFLRAACITITISRIEELLQLSLLQEREKILEVMHNRRMAVPFKVTKAMYTIDQVQCSLLETSKEMSDIHQDA